MPTSHASAGSLATSLPLLLIGLMLGLYLWGAWQEGRRWHRWRTASFALGAVLLAAAFLPGLVGWAHHDLRGHMLQHLLIGMLAPLALTLAAPVTLALRALPVRAARVTTALLHRRPVRIVSHPVTALLLNVGGMYALYLTPLYTLSLSNPWLHWWIHLHFLVAGYLFTWAIAGPDPAPGRPGLPLRLCVLFFAMAAHAYLSKLMYIELLPATGLHDPAQIRAAAKLMYYGGDVAELLVAVALFADWYRRRAPRRPRDRHAATAVMGAAPVHTSAGRGPFRITLRQTPDARRQAAGGRRQGRGNHPVPAPGLRRQVSACPPGARALVAPAAAALQRKQG